MITLRRTNERGKTKLNWLDSRHMFSFGDYYDPQHMVFRWRQFDFGVLRDFLRKDELSQSAALLSRS